MTGETTLTGRVRAIGGLKEKVLGAYRAGIRDIILPRDNEGDLEELPEGVREQTRFHLVETLDEAIAIVIRDDAAPSGSEAEAGKEAEAREDAEAGAREEAVAG